jgi:carbamoyltransferase
MVVLGVSGRRSDAAAALGMTGRLVAAAGEAELRAFADIGYSDTGGAPLRAIAACLEQAGLQPTDVDSIALVDERSWLRDGLIRTESTLAQLAPAASREARALARLPVTRVGAGLAAAALPASAMNGAGAVLVVDSRAHSGAVFKRDEQGALRFVRAIPGTGTLLRTAERLAARLGCTGQSLDALAELGAHEPASWTREIADILRWDEQRGVVCDGNGLAVLLDTIESDTVAPLSSADSPHREVQRRRGAIAASYVDRLVRILVDLAGTIGPKEASIGLGGDLFNSPRVNSRLIEALPGQLTLSPVPEHTGLVLGALLASSGFNHNGAIGQLDLGPAYTEAQIKGTLDNCRVDYVYEPVWSRLLPRVSQLLAHGKVIAWFQGRLDFGVRSLGSRSVLCDPSNRYARHNINEYLFARALDAPLAVTLKTEDAGRCLERPIDSPFMLLRGQFRTELADKLTGALDSSRSCIVHTVTRAQAPALVDLLDLHARETGVPALIHSPLCVAGRRMAATPRGAIQAVFSSSIDALVIGRFLLMKDYWLLRNLSLRPK